MLDTDGSGTVPYRELDKRLRENPPPKPPTPEPVAAPPPGPPPRPAAQATGAKPGRKRRAKTHRAPPRRDPGQYWNIGYTPSRMATEPLAQMKQPAEGWVSLDGTSQARRGTERRAANPAYNIELFGSRGGVASAKEAGVPRVAQQWKEGLREISSPQLSSEEAELEQLRTLLKRGEGVGTEGDEWTPYTGRGRDEIIRRAAEEYLTSERLHEQTSVA